MNKLSKYAHIFKVGNHNVFYHALTTKVFFISDLQAEKLKNKKIDDSFSDNEINLLKTKRLIVNPDEGINEINVDEIVKYNYQEKPDVFVLYLLLTERCNMNCLYCSHAHRAKSKQSNMDIETVLRALERFYSVDTKRKRSVVLYGGEPLINKKGVLAAIDYIRQTKKDNTTEIVIFTNGILLDEKLIRYFSLNDVRVIISIDGNRETHNNFRKKGNNGTFDTINRAIKIFNENGIKFGISATIAAHNIKTLGDVTEYFYQEFNPISVGLNPLHAKMLGDVTEYEFNPIEKEYSVSTEEVAEAMISAYKVAREKGLYIEQIMRRVRPFVLSTPRLKDCPACGAMIRVLPKGNFGPCGQSTEEGKNIESEGCSFSESELVKSWNRRLSCILRGCDSCDAMALCGGGCPANSAKNGGDLLCVGKDDRTCNQAKIILKWLLSELTTFFPNDKFIEIRESDKLKLLGNINTNEKTPLCEYSKYGEFKLNIIYK